MKLFNESKPHIKSKDTTNIIMTDILIAMIFLVILSFLYFGSRALLIIFISVVVSYSLDLICISILNKSFRLPDISSIVTGVIIALLMPAKVPMYVVISSCVFGILIAKQCFGGLGQNIFNPAAAGVAFSSLCWPDLMFIYPVPDIAVETGVMAESVCYILKLGAHPNISVVDMLLGKQPGPIGTVHILVIISCVLWLIIRKSVYWPEILSFITSCILIAFIFPRIHSARLLSVIYELFSGSLLFGSVFMITDPVTAPKYNISKIFYGAIIGILTMIFRYIGGFSQGICFAILIANSLSFSLDKIIYKHWGSFNILKLIRSRGDFSVKN
ncbi:MAG: RnfABCDGE type electron transport complex subunit D [Oscillospiraceae bacterium]|nr:RnfABCDGE type electron transport complex subunit D [Oscillospiraceae bacterium]